MLSVDLANAVKFSTCKLAVAPDASNVFVAKNSLSNRSRCKTKFGDNSEEDVRRGRKNIVLSLYDTKHTTLLFHYARPYGSESVCTTVRGRQGTSTLTRAVKTRFKTLSNLSFNRPLVRHLVDSNMHCLLLVY